MAGSLQNRWLLAIVACQFIVSSASADAPTDEQRIRYQLASATKLDCNLIPLPDAIDYLADYHDIKISLDRPEIDKMGLDLGPSQVTKKSAGRLDDTLTEILGPFNLSFMIDGDKLLITSQRNRSRENS